MKDRHRFHLVDRSPWPIVSAAGAWFLTIGLVFFMHRIEYGGYLVLLGFFILLSVMFVWWRDVIRESTYQGKHTIIVQRGIKKGFILFIISEIMFFSAFFWAVFHASLSPSIDGGLIWPPYDVKVLHALEMPLLNTLILILSSVTVTIAHQSLLLGDMQRFKIELLITIFLGFIFEGLQVMEYIEAPFNISDGVYGSTFYLLTGLHGTHVFIGALYLSVCLYRSINFTLLQKRHLGFEFAAWYWHFVDIVWIFLFFIIYVWGTH
jgi:cytochrome c oxidase subunit 3